MDEGAGWSAAVVRVGAVSLALYRRYRPETFADVIGQEHVTEPLQQALRNGRVHHAYLFSGPRGCGKTTSARILARCLNCEQGPTPEPCGQCSSCRDLARGGPGSIDVLEIDAASHGGVDDARELRERVFFAPVASRYKVYIIDEAHMVSSAGFNALLKVVEEPPEHVTFVFATTEPEKVIGTIRSRTHHYPFRLVPPGQLQDYLAKLCAQEGAAVEKGVLPLVVRAGRGSVRDSLSVLDQLLAGAGQQGVSYRMASALLGYTDTALLDETVEAFATADGAALFRVVDRVIEGGHDPRRFTEDLLERLRDLVILDAVPDAASGMFGDAPADQLERMRQQALRFGSAELSRAADLVNTGLTEMRGATAPRLQLELICARVLLPATADDARSVAARLDRLERRLSVGGTPAPTPAGAPAPAPQLVAPGPGPAGSPYHPSAAAPAAGADPGEVAERAALQRVDAERASMHRDAVVREALERAGDRGEDGVPSPEQPAQTVPVSGLDLAALRTMWPDVVQRTAGMRRATWTILLESQVLGYEDGTLSLGISQPGYFSAFKGSGHDEIVRQALLDEIGIDCRVEPVLLPASGSSGSSGSAGPAGGRRQGGAGPVAAERGAGPSAPATRSARPGRAAAEDRPGRRPDREEDRGEPRADVAAPETASASAASATSAASAASAARPHDPDAEVSPDDPDLEEAGLSSLELLRRDLGAKVIDEYDTV